MRKVFAVLIALVLIAIVFVSGWRWYLSAPSRGNWEEMTLVEQKSFWPHVTEYNLIMNGMSVSCNDVVVSESKWLDFRIWNGHGIDSVYVYAVVDTGEVLIYPGELASTSMYFKGCEGSGIIGGVAFISSGSKELPCRDFSFNLDPLPYDLVPEIHMVVIDVKGNITEKYVEYASIQ